ADDRNQNAALDIADARAALEKGELGDAAAKLRHALQLQPASSEAQRYLNVVLKKQGEGGAGPGPDDPKRVAEFEGYFRQGRFQEVEPLLSAYVTQSPKSSWGWYALGYSLFAQQKIGASINALAKSLELDIRNAEAHKTLGRNLMIIGRFDAAQVEFEQGLRYKPDSAEIHYNLGKLFSIQDNWEPARKAFEAALRIDPSYVEALDALGFALEALNDDPGAVANYEKAIALNQARHGSFASAHVNLSAFYNRTGDPARALEYARQAIELEPTSDRAWFQKGRADERQGRLDEAVSSVNRAISLNARASSYYYVLAGLYRRLGKAEESRKALESFTRLERETSEIEKQRRAASRGNPGAGRE
ncbi:MAG: tetratricopeptide repeat protein, partial [Acidobacteriota bacterium]|nr:tetratricopeptide repeat protein [Acidobacteriota bacterium]